MATTAKALAWREEIAAELRLRLSAIAQTKAFASDQAPTLLLGTGLTTTDSVFIKIAPVTSLQVDVLGLAQTVFTPHVIQMVIEANYEGATDTVLDVGTWATRLAVIGVLVSKGVKVELYVMANGSTLSASGITSGNLKATFENHVQYPGMTSL